MSSASSMIDGLSIGGNVGPFIGSSSTASLAGSSVGAGVYPSVASSAINGALSQSSSSSGDTISSTSRRRSVSGSVPNSAASASAYHEVTELLSGVRIEALPRLDEVTSQQILDRLLMICIRAGYNAVRKYFLYLKQFNISL